jgi:tyrosyl-tRNA synthetase
MSAPAPGGPGAGGLAGLLPELEWRGMLHQHTPGLPERLATGRVIAGYNGFDPSGESLHVGNLVPIFGLIRLQRAGGKPYALVGGGTGMIGDPSGKSSERVLLDRATLEHNAAAIHAQLERFLDFSPGIAQAVMVNNIDWLGELSLIDFLRDTGKHFTVPYMLDKDSVQIRLRQGLSFTEFSYMLLQAHDFAHLYRTHGVEMQMGGADQWGNITAGLELIRRTAGDGERSPAHGIAYPLLLSPSGTKFGKSEEGDSVWLDPARTSPFAFYQYWLNTDDRDAPIYLRWFTEFPRSRVEELDAALAARPEAREAQRALAADITARVHGDEAAGHAVRVSEAAFSREPLVDAAVLATLHEAVDGFTFTAEQARGSLVTLLVATGTFASNGEARRMIGGGGVTVNDVRVSTADAPVPPLIAAEWLVVRMGKRKLRVGRLMR